MSLLKKLAGQTALYGLPSIMVRFLNYLLVPIHVKCFDPAEYGVITELYAYVAFLVILLTYGMETTYFKFCLHHPKKLVFNTIMSLMIISSTFFMVGGSFSVDTIAQWLSYTSHPEYITWLIITLGLDALAAIPLANLRQEDKALKFAAVNTISIGVNILLNLFFIKYCFGKYNQGETNTLMRWTFDPAIGVGYVFLANLIASAVKLLLLAPQFTSWRPALQTQLIKPMFAYALPLVVVGLAGTVNETFSRGFFKYFLEPRIGYNATMTELGIFGAVYKLSILITLFIQAYRYAAEPFFFQQSKGENSGKGVYVQMMNIFTFIVFGLFLLVTLFLDWFKLFIDNPAYWSGLKVVPVLLLANAFLGISYNLSIWYKLSGKTSYGAYISVIGALVTLGLNYALIPRFGYVGAAWSTLACYTSLMVLSFLAGQRYYPIPYQWQKNLGFLLFAMAIYFADAQYNIGMGALQIAIKSVFLLTFAAVFLWVEKPKMIFRS